MIWGVSPGWPEISKETNGIFLHNHTCLDQTKWIRYGYKSRFLVNMRYIDESLNPNCCSLCGSSSWTSRHILAHLGYLLTSLNMMLTLHIEFPLFSNWCYGPKLSFPTLNCLWQRCTTYISQFVFELQYMRLFHCISSHKSFFAAESTSLSIWKVERQYLIFTILNSLGTSCEKEKKIKHLFFA